MNSEFKPVLVALAMGFVVFAVVAVLVVFGK